MDLQRFKDAQEASFPQALAEIKNGKKTTHWMWYIFPQIDGLGKSSTAKFYAIKNLGEAKAYLADETLGERLLTISEALLHVENRSAETIFGYPDVLKLQSSVTLFSRASKTEENIFKQVLQKYFAGKEDAETLKRL